MLSWKPRRRRIRLPNPDDDLRAWVDWQGGRLLRRPHERGRSTAEESPWQKNGHICRAWYFRAWFVWPFAEWPQASTVGQHQQAAPPGVSPSNAALYHEFVGRAVRSTR